MLTNSILRAESIWNAPGVDRLQIAFRREAQIRGDPPASLEAERHALAREETREQQSGADEQHLRERELGDDDGVMPPAYLRPPASRSVADAGDSVPCRAS